jgi:predicted transcriptional regulator
MPREVEISCLDLRYERLRMKNRTQEGRLLSSIAERGIDEALEGVDTNGACVLLNGFKRHRCARKLGIEIVPYTSLGADEATGIVALLRIPKTKRLNILEQAGFIDELRTLQSMSMAEISELLSRSKSWVSMRVGIISEMTATIRRKLFSGAFPAYPYLYTLRPFMRMNSVSKQQIERFVVALSGKNLSVREIEQLAHGYFRGPDSFREQIESGNIALPLERIRQVPDDPDGCSPFERGMLKDLETTGKYMQRVMGKSHDRRLKTRVFHAQANLLTAGIVSRSTAFFQTMRQLHDRTGQA